MKRILFYTDTPQIGGAEAQIFLLAKFFDKSKIVPVLACSNYPTLDDWCNKFEKEGIKVIRLNVKHKHDVRHFFALKKIIRNENIDILNAHVWNPASCRYAFMIKSVPVVITEHDPFKLPPLKQILKKKLLSNVAGVVAVSAENRRIIEEMFPFVKDKITVIHNGIDVSWWKSQLLRFTDEDYKKIKKDVFLANKNTLTIGTIAELHERKGLKYLIEAMQEIVERFPNVKLVLIGEGGEREHLEKFVSVKNLENHVVFTGRQKEIPKLLKSCDIFCLPSRREAFGLVNAEAMITGLPVVATEVGGIPEIVKNGETGLLVPPEDSGALACALISLIENPERRIEMGQLGKQRVYDLFDARVMAEKYEEFYL